MTNFIRLEQSELFGCSTCSNHKGPFIDLQTRPDPTYICEANCLPALARIAGYVHRDVFDEVADQIEVLNGKLKAKDQEISAVASDVRSLGREIAEVVRGELAEVIDLAVEREKRRPEPVGKASA